MTATSERERVVKNMMQRLLREEHAAAALCERALVKVSDSPHQDMLQRAVAAHRQAADLLRAHLYHHQIPLPEDVALRERDVSAIERAASSFDALEVVWRTEQQVIERYEEALRAPSLMPDCRVVIQQSLLPDRVRDASTLRPAARGG